MSKTSTNRSTMFLMEIIIAILFFSLVSAVCLRVFTKTHQMNAETENLNNAVNIAANTAELLRHSEGNLGGVKDEYPLSAIADDTLTAYYDAEWNACSDTGAAYQMRVVLPSAFASDGLHVYNIEIQDIGGADIYTLAVEQYVPNR